MDGICSVQNKACDLYVVLECSVGPEVPILKMCIFLFIWGEGHSFLIQSETFKNHLSHYIQLPISTKGETSNV